jgi:TonB family protein
MRKFLVFYIFISAVFLFPQIASAQKKDRIEVFTRLVENSVKNCKNLQLGQISFYLEPDYPNEAKAARIGGAVEVTIKFDEKGKFSEIEKVTGSRFLQGAASEAALKVRFSPTTCNGIPVSISGVVTYNFIPFVVAEGYFMPAKVEDFIDVKSDSQTYEAVVNLTENYKIAFGYEDRKFYTDAPLTHGDFAQFLRLTLDLISERAKNANKIPRQIGLFYPYNPNKLTSLDKIKEINKKVPYLDSLRVLLLKYDISLGGEKNEFDGKFPMTQNQLIDLWTKIFGAETVPINFERTIRNDKIITRGEFALFLQESLGVLTYKVLP